MARAKSNSMAEAVRHPATAETELVSNGRLVVHLRGDWRTQPRLPGVEGIQAALRHDHEARSLEFETGGLEMWNTGLLIFAIHCRDFCRARGIFFRLETLPEGLQHLIHLAEAVPDKDDARRSVRTESLLARVGRWGLRVQREVAGALAFLGETARAAGRLLRGKAQMRWADVALVMQQCGPEALGIVALINFLVGVILAFVGAVQLSRFGASIYIADLVAIGTVRELGAVMTAVIICGRTGAAFAAQLGTMNVTEEVDALNTFGISAMDFLVLPRLAALTLAMPFLCVFADLIAILGGFTVAVAMLNLTATEYVVRTLAVITLPNFLLGVCKGAFFGVLIALAGCSRGMQCGRSAAAVGQAATSAVVIGITSIIAADGIFAVLCNALGI